MGLLLDQKQYQQYNWMNYLGRWEYFVLSKFADYTERGEDVYLKYSQNDIGMNK